MKLHIEILQKNHNRKNFSCGEEILNNYIKHQVSQDIKKKLTVCFVLVDENEEVKGFYTLSNSSIPKVFVPEKFQKSLPRAYSDIPVTLLGRLAIDETIAKQGQAKRLLMDAFKESYLISETKLGSMAVVVDPINNQVESFYETFGFLKLDNGKMFKAMRAIAELFPNV